MKALTETKILDFFLLKYIVLWFLNKFIVTFQPKQQTAIHIVSSRQTATATSILRVLLASAGKDIRLNLDSVSRNANASKIIYSHQTTMLLPIKKV